MQRTQATRRTGRPSRKTEALIGGPLDGMTVPIGPGRTLLVPVQTDSGALLVAEYARPTRTGPFHWIRWAPARIAS